LALPVPPPIHFAEVGDEVLSKGVSYGKERKGVNTIREDWATDPNTNR
jgi:hypothetical protein